MWNSIGDAGVEALAASPILEQVSLNLRDNGIGDQRDSPGGFALS